MKKLITVILLALFPVLAMAADGSLSFAPPASDYSVIFLGNLFGIVDGVLHGTGSQIMGAMFGVFNSAVLALGGIIIMYTLMVSTMNTAHEGQMLGQKWSSIWIPVRSTLGLALLIPKASGYCLMQIFVMWVVVQGVGAADKVWEAALSYLNRGGVIIQAQTTQPPIMDVLNPSGTPGVPGGALTILSGQVCMMGLQKQLEAQRQSYLDLKNNKSGPCYGTPSPDMTSFCNTAVPDFISSVNAVSEQTKDKTASNFSLSMPYFDDAPFKALNGICGTITWNAISNLGNVNKGSANTPGPLKDFGGLNITSSEFETAQMSRAIAIQQMYMDLSLIAEVMVNNDPGVGSNTNRNQGSKTDKNFSLVAKQQFGVPYTNNGSICAKYADFCTTWGLSSNGTNSDSGVLFNGTEFQGAISDYNGIMMPTLNLIQQSKDSANENKSREFITQANSQGWMMAGAYFFDLVKLNGNAVTGSGKEDTNTGLDKSQFDASALLMPFGENGVCTGQYAFLCRWFNQDKTKLAQVEALIDGSILNSVRGVPVASNPVAKPDMRPTIQRPVIDGLQSSTVYGFINNSMMVRMPGQPGLAPLKFANIINFSVDTTPYRLKEQVFQCGPVKIIFFSFCLGEMFGNLFYNHIFLYVYNFFMAAFEQIINQVIMAFLMIPLQGMADIFQEGVKTISAPGVNPIIALANMGTTYINFAGNLWMMLLSLSVTSSLIPVFGAFIFALISLAMPLLLAWIGIMVSIGFTTAYYIPILPYLIFTFGAISWLISVIEAMVAAPIVALGITHPEGHDAFGKGEAAIMILMNVFLRPAMMIIGYIAAISLSYVGVWILNAGFDHAIGFIQGGASVGTTQTGWQTQTPNWDNSLPQGKGSGSGEYTEWAGIYAFFFSILTYTTMYLIIVQKSFTLISYLPDKVLRWIGGNPESAGQESAQWGEDVKQSSKEAAGKTQDAQGQMDKQLGGYGQQAVSAAKGGMDSGISGQGSMDAEGGESSSSGDDDSGGKAKKGAGMME